MIYQTYFVNAEDLKGITLNHARVTFCENDLLEIDYTYDDSINDDVKAEAEWFDRLTYTF